MKYIVETEGFVHHDLETRIEEFDSFKAAKEWADSFQYCVSKIFFNNEQIYPKIKSIISEPVTKLRLIK